MWAALLGAWSNKESIGSTTWIRAYMMVCDSGESWPLHEDIMSFDLARYDRNRMVLE
jgi:hypothetical protein